MSSDVVLIDDPAPQIRRITLNRPEKRNALNHALRGGILRALQAGHECGGGVGLVSRGAEVDLRLLLGVKRNVRARPSHPASQDVEGEMMRDAVKPRARARLARRAGGGRSCAAVRSSSRTSRAAFASTHATRAR